MSPRGPPGCLGAGAGGHGDGIANLLGGEPMGVALACGHRLVARERITPSDLTDETLIWLPRAMMPDQYDQVMTALQAGGFVPRAVRESPDTDTTLGLVAAGLGVSVKLETQVTRYGGEDAGLA